MRVFIILVGVFGLLFFAFAAGMAVGESSAFLEPDECNGWALRWLKHFICGAFCGHDWHSDYGSKEARCSRCGKTKQAPQEDEKRCMD